MSDTKERRLKITPGTAKVADVSTVYVLNEDGTNRISAQVQRGWETEWSGGGNRTTNEEVGAVATLYADAHNTANEVDMLPSELLARVKELEDVAKHTNELFVRVLGLDSVPAKELAEKARTIINKRS